MKSESYRVTESGLVAEIGSCTCMVGELRWNRTSKFWDYSLKELEIFYDSTYARLNAMEAPVYSAADAEQITTNGVTVVAAEDIDSTFRSDCIGTRDQAHQNIISNNQANNMVYRPYNKPSRFPHPRPIRRMVRRRLQPHNSDATHPQTRGFHARRRLVRWLGNS